MDRFTIPSLADLHRTLEGRTLIFWGDSLSKEEFDSAVLMLLCHSEGATPYCIETVFPASNAVSFPEINARMMLCEATLLLSAKQLPAASENFYIAEDGKKKNMRAQKASQRLDLDHKSLPGLITQFADQPKVVMIINFGHWFESFRSDTSIHLHGGRTQTRAERLEAIKVAVGFVAKFLQERLQESSLVIWHGFSPGVKKIRNACKVLHDFTKAIYSAVKPFLGRSQFFLNMGCALQSLPQGFVGETHYALPGNKDLEILHVFRVLNNHNNNHDNNNNNNSAPRQSLPVCHAAAINSRHQPVNGSCGA